jgi:hypothetical protein
MPSAVVRAAVDAGDDDLAWDDPNERGNEEGEGIQMNTKDSKRRLSCVRQQGWGRVRRARYIPG